MVEMPKGIRQHEYRSITHLKEGGSLAFAYSKDGWLANTVGHLFAIPIIHLPLWTLKDAFHNPPEELVKTLSDRWKDVPFKGDVLVRVGHASVIGDIKRLLATNDEIKGRVKFSTTAKWLDRAARYPYIPLQALTTLFVKMFRMNYYDPITNTLSVYHPDKAIGMHGIGKAKFYDTKKNPTHWYMASSLRVADTILTYKASENAMKHFASDAERKDGLKVLEPQFSGKLVSSLFGLFDNDVYRNLLSVPAGLIAGHITSRLPGLRLSKQHERFGYVFEGKPTYAKKNLGPHQVYASTARPVI